MAYDININPKGVDLSVYNLEEHEDIDWELFKCYYSFVIARASALGRKDSDFDEIYWGAHHSGVPAGAYHYFAFRSARNTKDQAHKFWESVSEQWPVLGMWMDLEDSSAGDYTKATRQNWVEKFLYNVSELSANPEVGIYTSKGYYDHYIVPPSGNATDIPRLTNPARARPLWIAHWFTQTPSIPWDWERRFGNDCYTMHQISNREDGEPAGIPDTTVDGNWYNGTYAEFNAQYHTNITVPDETPEVIPQPDPETSIIEIAFLQGGQTLNVRDKAWGNSKAMTWNGERFKVVATKGFDLNPEKYWIQIAGDPGSESTPADLWLASWYTIPVS